MQKVLIITISSKVAEGYKNFLKNFFDEDIIIGTKSVDADNFDFIECADVYLIGATSSENFEPIMAKIDKSKAVFIRLTFRQKEIDLLKAIKNGTEALLVNLSRQMAIETISDLHRLGVTNIILYPCYPNQENIPNLDMAITPGERRFVPGHISEVLDIGDRLLTANTIAELALRLDYSHILQSESYRQYVSTLAEQNYSIDLLTNKTMSIENAYQMLMESLDVAVIGIDVRGKIFVCNNAFCKIMNISRFELINRDFKTVLKKFYNHLEDSGLTKKVSKIIRINQTNFVLNVFPFCWENQYAGRYILLQRFSDTEKNQHHLRMQLMKKGHTAKYTFDDIIGNCQAICKIKEIAGKAARSDASILLTGESGTGKELFAHSIHKASKRSSMPFIALNCAAFQDSLLESELFGYVEGSFTGARKGGKLGLFEYAHGGTLFLDEIEGMSANLQIKLLRVLQEKEIIRVGGNRIIKIDVRIIAASNENIRELTLQNKFRKDLYYRLNTIPIEVPPLREREADVLVISEYIMNKIKAGFVLSPQVKEFFLKYRWEGNIRELYNVLEYLKYLDEKEIRIEHLPKYIIDFEPQEPHAALSYREKEVYILRLLESAFPLGLGRRKILDRCRTDEVGISESLIRKILSDLEKRDFITIAEGRCGTKINDRGISYLKSLGF
ncbi:sigma 54-interacting transcriptional regulator [Treponema sp. OMZ 792]|uniref:sigma-54 interaction domain-containing protein n=1 Tax=unclassified Treponema TaxID=2638727 RepID=UPI0020A35A5D|nr:MULTISPECIES: sigma 54-interacting transcriptional regulator [unclassified Treponema]UTC74248.1 sigma 54-interacting transcriptional regulator [Treponema sp. OMZ 792]UTC80645.1 sigma 54-interacting transcriptional regulator [Treponema sp. OMZ 798]